MAVWHLINEPLALLSPAIEAGHFGAPAKTPKERASQLTGWLKAALQAREFRAKLLPLGLYAVGMCGTDFAALLRKQYDDFGRVIREANIKAE